ncbi:D-arabinono-1,4-lactone oxidase [soil metagenome]
MEREWENWSGSIKFIPEKIEKPTSEAEVRDLVLKAKDELKDVKIVGAGHSSVPLVKTDKILFSLENFKGLVDYNSEKKQVKLKPGTNIEEAGKILMHLRMCMHNTGDVDFQQLGGAFGTGTHGSGKYLQNLSGMMIGCRLVDGMGKIREFNHESHPEMLKALRVGLGSLGIFTELTIQAEPAEQMSRMEFCTHIETCLEHLDELSEQNRMFDFYWHPRNDEAQIRICNPVGEGTKEMSFAKKLKEKEGWMYEILPNKRMIKYEEMEYAIPAEAGPECFREVRKRVKERHRHYVGWRVLYRTIAADDAYLSPFYNQESVTIALLQNNELEYKKYFDDMEPIFRDYGGRPHWGKKHNLKAHDLKTLYPEWDKFLDAKKLLDPDGIFLNDYLKEIFGI